MKWVTDQNGLRGAKPGLVAGLVASVLQALILGAPDRSIERVADLFPRLRRQPDNFTTATWFSHIHLGITDTTLWTFQAAHWL